MIHIILLLTDGIDMQIVTEPESNKVTHVIHKGEHRHFNTHECHSCDYTNKHEEIAESIKDLKLSSIIIFIDHLDEDISEDPYYASLEHYIICSELEEDAMRILERKFPDVDTVKSLLTSYGCSLSKGNHFTESEHVEHRIKLTDDFYHNLIYLETPALLEDRKEYLSEDEEGEPIPEDKLEATIAAGLMEYVSPRTRIHWSRKMDLPKILSHWDSRNPVQQYFFVERDGHTEVAQGGCGSSGSRWDIGIMTHAFAHLHRQGKQIPTYVMLYNSRNELILMDSYDTFRCVNRYHGGNYHIEHDKSEELLKGIVIDKDGADEDL